MKLIRAERNIHVPQNPEKPDRLSMRLVETNILALIPDDFELPEDSFSEVGKVRIEKKKEKDV